MVLDTGFNTWFWCRFGRWCGSWWVLDASDQDFKQQSSIGLEKPVVTALSVLGGGLGKLVVVSSRKDGRRWQYNSSQSILVHSHHGFLQFWWELPASNRPGEFVKFRVVLRREILNASWLIGGRKGLASNRQFNTNLGSIRNHCSDRLEMKMTVDKKTTSSQQNATNQK